MLDTAIRNTKAEFFKEQLAIGKNIEIKVIGNSMLPFLRSGDILIVKKAKISYIHPGEVVLTCKKSRFFAHRVFKRHKDSFITKADALIGFDAPCHEKELLGKAIGKKAGDKILSLETDAWRLKGLMILGAALFLAYVYVPLRFFRKVTRMVLKPLRN